MSSSSATITDPLLSLATVAMSPSRLYRALEDTDRFVLLAGLLKPHIHFLAGCLAILEVDEHISFNEGHSLEYLT